MSRLPWLLLLVPLPAYAAAPPPLLRDAYGDPLPPGARARLGTVRFRAVVDGWCWQWPTVVLSFDRKRLACTAPSGAVRVCSSATGQELLRVGEGTVWQYPGAFSSDGGLVATIGEDGRVRVYECRSGRLVLNVFASPTPDHESELLVRVAFPVGGKTLATWDGRGQLIVRDLRTGRVLRGERLATFGSLAEFSLDGQRLCVRTGENTLRLLDVRGGRSLLVDVPGQGALDLSSCCWSPDGRLLATACSGGARIVLVDATTGKERWRWGEEADWYVQAAFSPDGRTLAVEDESGLDLLDVATGQATRFLKVSGTRWLLGLLYLDSGRILLVNPYGVLQTHDAKTGRRQPCPQGLGSPGWDMSFCPRGRALGIFETNFDLGVFDTKTGQYRHVPCSPSDGEREEVLLLNGRSVACYKSIQNQLRLVDVPTGRPVWRPTRPEPWGRGGFGALGGRLAGPSKRGLSLSARRRLLSVSALLSTPRGWQSTVTVYRMEARTELMTLKVPECAIGSLSPDGRVLAIGWSERGQVLVQLVDPATGQARGLFTDKEHASYPSRILFSRDNRLIAALGERNFHVWERLSARLVTSGAPPPDFYWREAVMTRDERLLLVGARWKSADSFDDNSRNFHPAVWDLTTRRFVWSLPSPGRWHELALSPDGQTVAISLADTSILLYDVRVPPPGPPLTGQQLQSLWADLASPDAEQAWRAHRTLSKRPAQAIALLRGQLKPSTSPPPRQWLADLDADRFEKREAATKNLAAALARGETVVAWALRDLRERSPAAEVRARARRLLRPYEHRPLPLSPDALRTVRAVAVLERVASAEALALLKKLASGAPALLTAEARAALARLRGR
jgi:WD40 repeat protein